MNVVAPTDALGVRGRALAACAAETPIRELVDRPRADLWCAARSLARALIRAAEEERPSIEQALAAIAPVLLPEIECNDEASGPWWTQ